MNKPTAYIEKPLRHRRSRFVAKRWRINTDLQGRGVFFSWHTIPGTSVWEERARLSEQPGNLEQTHASIHFLSKAHARQGWWYNARVSTVEQAVGETIGDLIEDRLEESPLAFGPGFWVARRDAWAAFTPDQWERLPIQCGVSRCLKSPHSVGLDVVLPVSSLDVDALRGFVEGFWAQGEHEVAQDVDWPAHRAAIQQMVNDSASLFDRLALAEKK